MSQPEQKTTLSYILITALAVIFTWLLHEFSHWLTSELLGYESMMTLNKVSTDAEDKSEWHGMIISAAGPLVTILQALGVFLLLTFRTWRKTLYPLLFTAFYMRLLASVMNLISLNDEGAVSEYLGLGTFTIPIIVSAFLFYLVYSVSKQHQLSWKFQLSTTLTVMVVSSVLILVDQFYHIRLL